MSHVCYDAIIMYSGPEVVVKAKPHGISKSVSFEPLFEHTCHIVKELA